MINIFGVISPNNVVSALFHGLQQLEADGYASVGITTLNGGQVKPQHTYENPQNWPNLLCEQPKLASFGIAYTVWEKLGQVAPVAYFSRSSENIALVYDGVIENYQDLRQELVDQDCQFETSTHSELVMKLLTFYFNLGLSMEEISLLMTARLRGRFAAIALIGEQEDKLLAISQGRPLALGIGEENSLFITSNANTLGLLSHRVIQVTGGRQSNHLVLDLNKYHALLAKTKVRKSSLRLPAVTRSINIANNVSNLVSAY